MIDTNKTKPYLNKLEIVPIRCPHLTYSEVIIMSAKKQMTYLISKIR